MCASPQHGLLYYICYVFVQYVILSMFMTYDGVNVCGNLGRSVGRNGKNREEKWEKRKEIYVNFQAICASHTPTLRASVAMRAPSQG